MPIAHQANALQESPYGALRLLATTASDVIPFALAGQFLLAAWWIAWAVTGDSTLAAYVGAAAVFGAYMALNIGANDVANNVAAAVGSRALTLGGAVLIAVVLESAGAILAGSDVVSTIRKGIVDPAAILATAFTVYMAMKGLAKFWQPTALTVMYCAIAAFCLTLALVRPMVLRASAKLENRRKSINTLFNIPLICAAALLYKLLGQDGGRAKASAL